MITHVSFVDAASRKWELVRGRELRRRSPYQLARWIARRRTLGALATLGQDCTVRVLERIRATLADGVPPDVERDWEVFN